jgi:hypothetical protein
LEKIIEFVAKNMGIFLSTIGSILGLFVNFKTNFWKSDKVMNGRYAHFKTIRAEYLKDNINGYFALQNYLGMRLPKEEIDFILNSTDAYKIMSLVKAAAGRYKFDGNYFHANIAKTKYVLPMIGYFSSSIPILFYLSFATDIVKITGWYEYFLFLFIILGIFGPILFTSLVSINEISKTRYLERITSENKVKTNIIERKVLCQIIEYLNDSNYVNLLLAEKLNDNPYDLLKNKKIEKTGKLDNDSIFYSFNGIGCSVKTKDYQINFDYSSDGKIRTFNSLMVYRYSKNKILEDEFKLAYEGLRKKKIIKASKDITRKQDELSDSIQWI